MDLEVGKVISLANNEAYLIANHFLHDGQEYVGLISVNEPVHIRFAEVNEGDDKTFVNIVEDDNLISLFKEYAINEFFNPNALDED